MVKSSTFNRKFWAYIIGDDWNEGQQYYKNHKYRYNKLLNIYEKVRKEKTSTLDIGGGQLGILAQKTFEDDEITVADIGEPKYFKWLEYNGVKTISWDLCYGVGTDFYPDLGEYDVIFFSEVLEHLPVPAYEIFQNLKLILKPGGVIICCVPNLTSLENIFSFIFNIPVFSYFQGPTGKDEGHVIMYTKEHLEWQIKTAGLKIESIGYEMSYKYHRTIWRNILFALSFPLFIFPHLRTEIISIIRKET